MRELLKIGCKFITSKRLKKMNDAEKFWNERFSTDEFIFGREPNKYLKIKSDLYLRKQGRILSIADGEGRNSVWLAKHDHQVEAFDISQVAIEKAKSFAAQSQVEVAYQRADCDSFIWPTEKYDAVIAVFIQFADPELRQRIFANIFKTLKSGGLLILQGYTPKQLDYKTGGPGELSHLYTEELIRNLLSEMEILEIESYEEELQEGVRHRGMSALMGVVARKN